MKSITSVHVAITLWLLFVVAIGVWNMTQPNDIDDVIVIANTPSETGGTPAEAADPVYVCDPVQTPDDKSMVLIRIDDVQAYAWAATTWMMIEDAIEREVPLTLGVIPHNLHQDQPLIDFLRQRNCHLEFAMHGFTHLSSAEGEHIHGEFEILSYLQAHERLAAGLEKMKLLTDEPIQSWIPPLNQHSVGTQKALSEFGITRWSTEGDAYWDYDAATVAYERVNGASAFTPELVPTDEVVASCEKSFEDSNVCVIMLHPQDFTTNDLHDEEKYNSYYIGLLDKLADKGYSFGRFMDADS